MNCVFQFLALKWNQNLRARENVIFSEELSYSFPFTSGELQRGQVTVCEHPAT